MSKGKIILKGIISLLSPAIIGSGRDENSDIDVLRDSDGTVYIPATSLVGVLRHHLKIDGSKKSLVNEFWGSKGESDMDLIQSSVIVHDLLPLEKTTVVIRDGVKIDNKKGIAEDRAKFDYEIIERGAKFSLYMEVTLNGTEEGFKTQMLNTIVKSLQGEKIRVGAKTNSGFGRIKLIDPVFYRFDFSKKADVLRWFKQDFSVPSEITSEVIKFNERTFTIDALFGIKNSLIVRSNNYDPDLPDVEHIKSNGKAVLPGTSLKGAIRARAERVINTLGKSNTLITDLFGYADENKKKSKRGRIVIEETIVDGYPEEVQTRIKIDRFTGGVMEGALLETKPLFRSTKEETFMVRLSINDYKDYEAGLMLLVLKDLWTGDLPIGGEKAIGRGVLEGKRACISWDNEKVEFQDILALKAEQKAKLQCFVSALVNHGGAA